MVEYSSPNTNKPLHLGHLRNNFLGWSIAEIFKANGDEVIKTCIVNDRGIHICKSMLAWQLFANGATPESTHTKGDHFVGNYYVKFNDELSKQTKPILAKIQSKDFSLFDENDRIKLQKHVEAKEKLESLLEKAIVSLDQNAVEKIDSRLKELIEKAIQHSINWKSIIKFFDGSEFDNLDTKEKEAAQKQLQKLLKPIISIEEKIEDENGEIKEIAQNKTELMKATQQMLLDWEAGKPAVLQLWKEMNSWVYAGFDATYKRIGSDFDKIYYESDTYLLGKDLVEEGLKKGVFFQKEDGSVWIDLTADGLDQKIVRRRDGTSVYITQDIGLAVNKYEEYKCDQSIYVVGDEQNYHFKVLKLIAQKLGLPAADGIFHLSYGMVELPTGKMKSREGTVVDADDLVDGMVQIAQQKTEELGKVKDFNEDELAGLYDTLGLGALKFFLLRVDPKKRMVFNPEESIEFTGFTGPFIQFTHARTKSILRKEQPSKAKLTGSLLPLEKNVIIELEKYPTILEQAKVEMNPSAIALYVFKLAQTFSTFVTELRVLTAETEEKKELRLQLCQMTVNVISSAMHILGIKVPDRM
ncbi:arginine--tRNA ligase [Paraflavitalea speifideaquila]|uniref:arginine--tRNA ligase n=1 Tax=Paraflavitalea speifideaquila TaxID=3076558 RepID=UPI0028E647BA|nr:arginine--tRNA ligase [Paraflavitalea speifideiaquila]